MLQWLLPVLVTTLTTLLVAGGVQYYTRRNVKQDELEKETTSRSTAKIGAETHLLAMLLDRIEKLEKRLDDNAQRSIERNARIEDLENDRDGCKQELEALAVDHAKLKERFEKELGHLVDANTALQDQN